VFPVSALGQFVFSFLEVVEDGMEFWRLKEPLRNVLDRIYVTFVVVYEELLAVFNLAESEDAEEG
jgi:hypothetical protein